MKKWILISLLACASMAHAIEQDEKKAVETICENKVSTQSNIRQLSDYELLRAWNSLLTDPRLNTFKTPRQIEIWLNDQTDCDSWAPRVYVLEVKWMLQEAFGRNMWPALEKMQNGNIRMNGRGVLEEKVNNKAWTPWNTYRK